MVPLGLEDHVLFEIRNCLVAIYVFSKHFRAVIP